MKGRSLFVVCGLPVIVGALAWWLTRSDGGSPTPSLAAPQSAPAPSAGLEGQLETPGGASPRSRAAEETVAGEDGDEVTEPARPSNSARAAEPWTVRGRVLDPTGAAVGGASVARRQEPERALATSLGDGRFELELELESAELVASLPAWVTVRYAVVVRDRPRSEALIVVAPALRLAGRVVDDRGEPVGGASFSWSATSMGIVGFPHTLEETSPLPSRWSAARDGAFVLDAPKLHPARITVTADGHRDGFLAVPEEGRTDLVVELVRESAVVEELVSEPTLFGTVRLPGGAPARGAFVGLGSARTQTDDDGRWELRRPDWVAEGSVLAARLEGYQPAVVTDPATWSGGGLRVGPIELVLPGLELAIVGRVVDADGAPLAGWAMGLVDATPLDASTIPSPSVEGGGKRAVTTGPDGGFRLGGLRDRAYVVRAHDPSTYLSITSDPLPAGTDDVELVLPADALLERLSGAVVTHGGVPVAGAEVRLRFVLARIRGGMSWDDAAKAHTDEDGKFLLERVPRRGLLVTVTGRGIVDLSVEPEGGELDQRPLTLVVWRRVDVRCDFSGMDPIPDAVRMLDERGEPLSIEARSASGWSSSTRLGLQQGRSAVVSVSEQARTLELGFGARVETRPLTLVPGEVNEIRP